MAQEVPPVPDALTFRAYKQHPPLPNLDTVVRDWTDAQISAWDEAATDADQHNRAAWTYNQKVESAWLDFMAQAGVQSRGARGGTPSYMREILQQMKVSAGVRGVPGSVGDRSSGWSFRDPDGALRPLSVLSVRVTTYTKLGDVVPLIRRRRAKLEGEAVKADERACRIMGLGMQYGIHSEKFPSIEEFMAAVVDEDKRRWVEENFPEGAAVEISSCDTCSTWTVGEYRCSCGNRRMGLEVEGDVGSWYAYPVPN